MSEMRRVTTAEDLASLATLTDIVFHTFSAERGPFAAEDPTFTDEPRLELATHQDNEGVALQMELRLAGEPNIRYHVAAVATYHLSEPVDIPHDVLTDFISRAAVLAVYPFVREGVVSLAGRLRAPAPILGLIRPGDVRADD